MYTVIATRYNHNANLTHRKVTEFDSFESAHTYYEFIRSGNCTNASLINPDGTCDYFLCKPLR